ncbi:MAG TPA: glycosyltransferase [Ferruginibacter sp.]|nr:glycosyltransferase [Ferruginibacter sp.]
MNTTPKIKLLILTPTLQCGGSEKFVSLLCNNINTDLFSVSLAVLNNKNPFYKITNPAIEVADLQEPRVRYALFKIKKLVKQYQPHIVFTTANHLNLYLAIFRWAFPGKIKFVARESSIVSINSQRAKLPPVYNRLIKKYFKRFDLIICQSAYMMQDLISNYGVPANKTTLIHNAVQDAAVSKTAYAARGADKIHKFITVSRLSAEKGIERLIHAVGLLSFEFQYYITGAGKRKAYLQNLVHELQMEDKIFFSDEKTDPFSGMEDADLFLMGSYYEGFPNVLLEAGALGIPVIAFDVPGGINEIISEGENGLLVDDNDLIAFAMAIRNATSLAFNRRKITENTLKRFSVNTIVAQFEQLFRQMN